MPSACQFERMLHLLQLGLPAHELRKPPLRGGLQARAQRSQPGYFNHVDRLADALNGGRAERLEGEVSLAQLARCLGHRHRANRRQRLHPRSKVRRMSDWSVFGMPLAGGDRADHHLAGVHAGTGLNR